MTDEVTDNGSRGLRKLCGEMDYDDWAMAAQARLGKRGLWDVITGPRPARRELAVSEDERELELKRRTAQRAFEQSQKDQGIHSWGDGPLPVTLLGPVPTTRLERESEYCTRVQRWLDRNKELWEELIPSLSAEGLNIARRVPASDGKAVWDALHNRYGNITTASVVTVLDDLFTCKMRAGGRIKEHVADWERVNLKAQRAGLDFSQNPVLQSYLFLRTLPEQFKPYAAIRYETGVENPTAVYQGAIEFAKTSLNGDEADTSGQALWGAEQSSGDAKTCKFGAKCKFWKKGSSYVHYCSERCELKLLYARCAPGIGIRRSRPRTR